MKILFIQNNGIQESIGIASLSGILKAHGHQTELLLVSHTPNLIEAIRHSAPNLIAFSALTGVHQAIILLAREIKKYFPIPIIVGGPHPTYSPEMIDIPEIDFICRGEGEHALLELVDRMERNLDITRVKNIFYKDSRGQIYKNDLRAPANLEELPFPDREIYYKYDFLKNVPMKRFISSIGCPYPCTFCHEPVIRAMYLRKGKYVRRKSVRRTVNEIKFIQERYPLKHVHFSDDLFFIRNAYDWLEEFAEIYPKEIGLPWNCNIRYDSVNKKAAELLEKALCYGAAVGLESGNEHLRETVIRKRSTNEHIIEGANLLREIGVKVLTTNMIGLPGETLDQAFETVELNMVLKSDFTRATTFLLFPGLPMVDYAKKNGFIDPNFDIDKHVAESMEINLITPWAKEFRNIASLFWIFVKFSPKWIPFFKKIVRLPDNFLFRMLGSFNMVQELLFYRIRPVAGFRFFKNTVLMTRRSGLQMTMRSIPSLFRLQNIFRIFRKKKDSIVSNQTIFEGDRGYF